MRRRAGCGRSLKELTERVQRRSDCPGGANELYILETFSEGEQNVVSRGKVEGVAHVAQICPDRPLQTRPRFYAR